jgi:tellurite resistance protein TerC
MEEGMSAPLWAWLALGAAIAGFLAADLWVGRRCRPSLRRAVLTSAAWIGAGVAFGVVFGVFAGEDLAGQYFAGYLLEKSLSVDNVFVFAMIFASLGIGAAQQRRVLFYGVVGALVLRAVFIAGGAALVEHLGWVLDVFAVALLVAAWRMARGHPFRPDSSRALRLVRRLLPMSADADSPRFFSRRDGRLAATPLLLALVAVEGADIIFAADSIPAVFGVTRNTFVIFASNAFAVLGLRALYLVFAEALGRFAYLRHGLAVLLAFVGVKMLADNWLHVPHAVTLGVIVVTVGTSVLASLAWPPRAATVVRPGRGAELVGT